MRESASKFSQCYEIVSEGMVSGKGWAFLSCCREGFSIVLEVHVVLAC